MLEVKSFDALNINRLKSEINVWLDSKNFKSLEEVEIHYQATQTKKDVSDVVIYTALIFYKKPPN